MPTTTTTRTPIDHTFAALADPTRVGIVTRLSRGVASVSELAEPFDMSLRAVLKHIEVLEDAGIVRTMKAGRVRRCELDRSQIEQASRWIEQVRHRWERRLDRLEDYVQEESR
jgi:DNA-binding transcriptional ArsR family regulator